MVAVPAGFGSFETVFGEPTFVLFGTCSSGVVVSGGFVFELRCRSIGCSTVGPVLLYTCWSLVSHMLNKF